MWSDLHPIRGYEPVLPQMCPPFFFNIVSHVALYSVCSRPETKSLHKPCNFDLVPHGIVSLGVLTPLKHRDKPFFSHRTRFAPEIAHVSRDAPACSHWRSRSCDRCPPQLAATKTATEVATGVGVQRTPCLARCFACFNYARSCPLAAPFNGTHTPRPDPMMELTYVRPDDGFWRLLMDVFVASGRGLVVNCARVDLESVRHRRVNCCCVRVGGWMQALREAAGLVSENPSSRLYVFCVSLCREKESLHVEHHASAHEISARHQAKRESRGSTRRILYHLIVFEEKDTRFVKDY